MDLIYTDAKRIDQGVLSAYSFDLSFGADENDFELTLGADELLLEFGSFIYIEGTEYGGIVDGRKTSTKGETITYTGRTWHGMLNSKVIEPDSGENYLVVSGEAGAVIAALLERLGLSALFSAAVESDVTIKKYQFNRYCAAYDGIKAMLAAAGAKLKIAWRERQVFLSAEPIADYTDSPIDGDIASLTVEKHQQKVNHLICLGKGNLAEREVIHLYANSAGGIGDTQTFTGLEEVCEVYDYSAVESSEELRSGGVKKLKELRDIDKAEISLLESQQLFFDVGDKIGATEYLSGITVAATVSQKIVKINNGEISTEYKAGG